MGKRLSELPRDVLRQLMEYDYPGNVRELENILIQAMFMMDGDSGFTTELLDLPAPGKAVGPAWHRLSGGRVPAGLYRAH